MSNYEFKNKQWEIKFDLPDCLMDPLFDNSRLHGMPTHNPTMDTSIHTVMEENKPIYDLLIKWMDAIRDGNKPREDSYVKHKVDGKTYVFKNLWPCKLKYPLDECKDTNAVIEVTFHYDWCGEVKDG